MYLSIWIHLTYIKLKSRALPDWIIILLYSYARDFTPGPAVIKVFESENDLRCRNCLRDLLETMCLFSNIWENCLRHFTISVYRYNYLAKFLLFSRKSYDKILENIKFSSFMTVAPGYLQGLWKHYYIVCFLRNLNFRDLFCTQLKISLL